MKLAEKSESQKQPYVIESAKRAIERLKKSGFPTELLEGRARKTK